ncbi:hypothetical protein THAOC_36046 [Thalassiosira oceanica]|uniref:Uncharacterized protein n=1 Tax=Thalassiosira oceanica TaxID=159749 RepID=K0R008_THAOC|nr:hypothetical protein THAOC_36046 [Thalassiosira oceanica]|eukprot:EJK45343.1 hypothetical protein THAOC_36046 [Thalassiosira oceanica]
MPRTDEGGQKSATGLLIESDPDEDDTTPSGRKRQHRKKGEVELGALERAAEQIFKQALGNSGRVPHKAYQRKIDELNDTPGVTLTFNKKDLENRVQAKLKRHKAEQRREAVGSRESTRSSASGNARPRQRHRPDAGPPTAASRHGGRQPLAASQRRRQPSDNGRKRRQSSRSSDTAPRASARAQGIENEAPPARRGEAFTSAGSGPSSSSPQLRIGTPAKSNDEGEEEDGDGKSVDSFDSDATPPADDDIVLGGDTGDGELEEPLHEGEEVGEEEEGKEEEQEEGKEEEQEEEAQPRGERGRRRGGGRWQNACRTQRKMRRNPTQIDLLWNVTANDTRQLGLNCVQYS